MWTRALNFFFFPFTIGMHMRPFWRLSQATLLLVASCALPGGVKSFSHQAFHSTGQERLQGCALKVAQNRGMCYPSDRSTATTTVQEATIRTFYTAVYPVAKRNTLFILDQLVPDLAAAWPPGMPIPATATTDDFVTLPLLTWHPSWSSKGLGGHGGL